jgi:hypothetical protein
MFFQMLEVMSLAFQKMLFNILIAREMTVKLKFALLIPDLLQITVPGIFS